MAILLYFLYRRIYRVLAFSIKETFAGGETPIFSDDADFPGERGEVGWAGPEHNKRASCCGPGPLAPVFVLLFKLDFRLNLAAIVFSIARNHLIGMTYGKMFPPSAARLPKTNHTGLLSEPKADCLGKSTSSSASG
jgi:hypothetical protein